MIQENKGREKLIFPVLGIISFFLPWIKLKGSFMGISDSNSFSAARIGDLKPMPMLETILNPTLLWLLPLCFAGIVASHVVPNIAPYRRLLLIGSIVVMLYAAIGVWTTHIEEIQSIGNSNIDRIFQQSLQSFMNNTISVKAGFGFYLSLLATVATIFFNRKKEDVNSQTNKQAII